MRTSMIVLVLLLLVWLIGGYAWAGWATLGVLAWLVYGYFTDPRRKIRKLHKDAWKKVEKSSQTYYDNVEKTLRR